jgi:molecular chaperone GrpE
MESKNTEQGKASPGNGEPVKIKVEDRRYWAQDEYEENGEAEPPSTQPTIIDDYRQRTEDAERQLQEYIAAFKKSQAEQEEYRLRLERDVGRKVELKFGAVAAELLECLDELEIAADHVREAPDAEPLARGVDLVRDRFLSTLERNGVERIDVDGEEFDPNEAEAIRLDPVDDPELDGKVTETVRPGYRLGDRVIRPARVAVGKAR